MSITVPIGVFRWFSGYRGKKGVFLGVFLGVKGGGVPFRGFWGVSWFFGGKFLSLEKFRVKYRNIPIIAFRGRSIIR